MTLEISDLRFGYGRLKLFDGLSIPALIPGELVALVGPNGVGKSSLFRLIAGLLRPHAGEIRLHGANALQLSHQSRAQKMFLLTQQSGFRAAIPVFESILLSRRGWQGGRATVADVARVEAMLDALGISSLSDAPANELSGGQQQLVAMAQALVRDPEVLLLDEPTSALDLRRQIEVMQLVRNATRNRNIVVIAALHDLGLAARFADRFLLLENGAVAADGEPEAVLRDSATGRVYGVEIDIARTERGTLVVDAHLA